MRRIHSLGAGLALLTASGEAFAQPINPEVIAQTSNVFAFAIAFVTGLFAFLAAWATNRSALAKERAAIAKERAEEMAAIHLGDPTPLALATLTARVDEIARKVDVVVSGGAQLSMSLVELRADLRIMLELLRHPQRFALPGDIN